MLYDPSETAVSKAKALYRVQPRMAIAERDEKYGDLVPHTVRTKIGQKVVARSLYNLAKIFFNPVTETRGRRVKQVLTSGEGVGIAKNHYSLDELKEEVVCDKNLIEIMESKNAEGSDTVADKVSTRGLQLVARNVRALLTTR
jgi:hypothetical protein